MMVIATLQIKSGLAAGQSLTLRATGSSITFNDSSTGRNPHQIPLQPSTVTITAGAPSTFTESGGQWRTTADSASAANNQIILFAVASYQLPLGFSPAEGQTVQWDAMFELVDAPPAGVEISWMFTVAQYSDLPIDLMALQPLPVAGTYPGGLTGVDYAAGTPQASTYQTNVMAGARRQPTGAETDYYNWTGEYCAKVFLSLLCQP